MRKNIVEAETWECFDLESLHHVYAFSCSLFALDVISSKAYLSDERLSI